jgi:hypothetical protein
MISIVAQSFIEEIISGTAESIISKKNNNKFLEWKELNELLKVYFNNFRRKVYIQIVLNFTAII